ncbi:MAG: hypothetical protein A2804_02855 [Candidatus Pacebacteria bacterium RIFCSPHIGHO2_01_FULL_46_10]|nr:MAG: hypothetical protein A2804_02855 [Candidatus Pacebacteria bacterium RIFCSPHIGHO2_01_FULL_46_10]
MKIFSPSLSSSSRFPGHFPSQQSHVKQAVSILLPLAILGLGIVLGVLNIKTLRLLFIGATGDPANIMIDTQAVLGPMPRPWRNLAQGGEDKNWRITPILDQVKALHPEYIRIDHIYDFYDIVQGTPGNLTFHWEKFDLIISDILAVGAKPYISLSYTPMLLAPNGDITGTPTDWGAYQLVIQKTVEHLSKDRGIDNVMYEVWNEPDLFGGWKTYGPKNYLTLYSYAAHGADTAADNGAKPFKFGGPAITALYKNWFDNVLKFASDNRLRLDFFSWHRYDREIDVYQKDVAHAKEWLDAYPQYPTLEFHITEWGHDPKNDAGYDGGYGAAHTAAVASEMMGSIQRGFVFEIQDSADPAGKQYWGRWGLFTSQSSGSRQKPRYAALRLIDRIGDQRLQLLGKGTWVKGMAARLGDAVTVVLANFDPVGKHGETVPVTFTNLLNQSFLLEQTFLDGTQRSAQIATTEAELRVMIPMLPNSVAFIKLTPQK